jgi:lipopolysaccharide export LptBFGC system permease protein LptF
MILGLIKKIGQWGIFSKAGISEWKSLVPVYNQIQLLKICKLSPWLVVLYLDFLIPIIGFYAGRDVSWTFIIMLIGFLCYRFMIAVRLGYCYKKGAVLPFFMAFFPSIFFPIIGCSKKEEYTELVIQKKSKRKDK